MNEKKYGLLEILQQADDQIIYETGQPWQKRKRKWDMGTKAAGILLVAAIGLMGIFHEQVTAAIRGFSTFLGEFMENTRELDPYTETMDLTQTVDGISLTLEEVVLDSNRLLALFEMNFDEAAAKKAEDYECLWGYIGRLKIDGTYLDSLAASGTQMDADGQIVMEYSFEEDAVSENMSAVELEVQIADQKTGGWSDPVADFKFSFETTKEQLQAKTKVTPLNVEMDTGEGITLQLKEMRNTDLGSRIRVAFSTDPREWYGEGEERFENIPYDLEIEDDQGNCIRYSVAGTYLEEEITDVLYESIFGTPPAEDAEYLTIRLYKNEIQPYQENAETNKEPDEPVQFPEPIQEMRVDLN